MATEAKRQRRIFPQVSVYFEPPILEIIERLADELGVKRSEVIRELVSSALVRRGLLAA